MRMLFAVILLSASYSATGQISYTDIPDTTISATTQQQMRSYFIDFDKDGSYEKEIRHFNPGGGMSPAVELGNNPNITCEVVLLSTHAKVMQVGDSVGPGQVWGQDGHGILNAPWYGGEKYLATRFKKGSNWYYGWVRFSVPANASSFTVKDFAYNTTPNKGVLVGQPVATGIAQIENTGISIEMHQRVVKITSVGRTISRLCDLNGRIVKTRETHGAATMDVSDLQPGIYVLTVAAGTEIRSYKILLS